MQFFTKVPWVNLFFSERTVMSVRSRFRNDGAQHYEQVESGLGKMTVGKFERVLAESGLKADYVRYDCVKRLDVLKVLPRVRELFINNVSCELVLRDEPAVGRGPVTPPNRSHRRSHHGLLTWM